MCVRTNIKYVRAHAYSASVEDVHDDGDSTPVGVRAWAALLRVHASLVPALDRELHAAVGLPLAWYDVLLELNSAPGRRLPMTDLGERVVLSRTRVSRLVDELESAGYVERQPHPTDRRSTLAAITPAGRRRMRAAAPVYLAGIANHFARYLNADELRTIATALERVRNATESVPIGR
jgi:DNA-binding MarR family transcriptional regulator